MRRFWTLMALGIVGFLTGTIGVAVQSREVRETTHEVSAPAPAVDVTPPVHL
jgi:hypothetical protein